MAQIHLMPLSHALSARPNGEPAGRAERHNRDHWVFAELGLVVGVKPHALIAIPVAVGQDTVEGHAGPLADASQESSGCRCEGSRLERLPRVAIAHVAGSGDQARLEDTSAQTARSHAASRAARRGGPPTRRPPPRAEATPARGRARRRMRARCACRWTAVRIPDGTMPIIGSWTVACPGCVRLVLVRLAPPIDHNARLIQPRGPAARGQPRASRCRCQNRVDTCRWLYRWLSRVIACLSRSSSVVQTGTTADRENTGDSCA
jgi:hypothetical protein